MSEWLLHLDNYNIISKIYECVFVRVVKEVDLRSSDVMSHGFDPRRTHDIKNYITI